MLSNEVYGGMPPKPQQSFQVVIKVYGSSPEATASGLKAFLTGYIQQWLYPGESIELEVTKC